MKQERGITNLFHKQFHQCSIDNECSYVVHYMNTNEYKKIGKQTLPPFSQNGCKIWKKMAIEESTEGQAASELSFYIYHQSKDYYARYLLRYYKDTLLICEYDSLRSKISCLPCGMKKQVRYT